MRSAARKARVLYSGLALGCVGFVTLHGLWKLFLWMVS